MPKKQRTLLGVKKRMTQGSSVPAAWAATDDAAEDVILAYEVLDERPAPALADRAWAAWLASRSSRRPRPGLWHRLVRLSGLALLVLAVLP